MSVSDKKVSPAKKKKKGRRGKPIRRNKHARAAKKKNSKLQREYEACQENLSKYRGQLESLVRVFNSRLKEATRAETERLVAERGKYERLISAMKSERNEFEKQLSRFDSLRDAYVAAFGEMRVKEIERQAIGAEICPRCNGLGGAHSDCPLCAGNGWMPV